MNERPRALLRLSLLAALLASCAALAQPAPRPFAVPGHGSLELGVPAGWRVMDRPIAEPPANAIVMRPATGDAFNLQITVLRPEPAKLAELTPQALKERAQGLAKKMQPSPVEGAADILELRGANTRGYYFSLTDRASKNTGGDYRYGTQGIAVSAEVMTIFTLLHRDAAAPEKEQTLRMLADAAFVKGATPAAAAPRQDALSIAESPQGYVLSVPVSRLVMTLPKGGMQFAPTPVNPGGHPRYFSFAGALNVSGWFESAQKYKGKQASWDGDVAEWNKRGLPRPLDVAFTKIGDWDTVIYDLAVPGLSMTNSHIRAHWVQAGTWIDLHVSVASRATSAEARAQLMQFVRSIQVREKDK